VLPDRNNFFLTGFMGSGKTTVGLRLSRELGSREKRWTFVDTDQLIEERAGISVSEIFKNQGEPAFRALEAEVIGLVCSRRDLVVALGGGALLKDSSRKRVLESGTLVFLQASVETLAKRLEKETHRPLLAGLTGESLRTKIGEMLRQREPLYRKAHVAIATDGKEPIDIAREVMAWHRK